MVSLLTDLVKTYVEKLINGAIRESRYVCCFTCIAEEFEDKKRGLVEAMNDVKEEAGEARRRGKNIRVRARDWEKRANDLIQKDTKTREQCFFGFCPDCIWRYKRGKELTNNLKEMEQLVEKRKELGNIERPSHHSRIKIYSSQDYISLKSRELKYKELLEALKDENNFITGLLGMGGTGKTKLAIEVGKELDQSNEFSYVIITTVSYTPNIKKIQDDIAEQLGLEFGDCNESDRSKLMLWNRLTNGEKNLVILDDVWAWNPPLDFDAIGLPKQDNHKGCRVLVTTRNKRVLNKMGCDEVIKLDLLSKEDAWFMFERYSGISNSSVKSLIDKGRKIAEECKRLPIAISLVASSLKGQQSPEEWDVALKSLQNPLSSIQGVEDESLIEVYNCLKFSYDYLKDEKAKGLFLLCSVFPEDEEIPVETLTRLGVAVGLFGEDYGSYNDARNQAVVATNKLLDSSLLLEADEESVKMHDLVRDAAQLIANQEIRTVDMSHKDPKLLVDRENNTKYLFCQGKTSEMCSSSFGGSKLEILIAAFNADGDGDCVELPDSFFENMTRLRALFICVDYQPLSLPHSFHLKNIRSLKVSRADLGDISVLGNLHCLETLDLFACKIDELPHAITELEKFKLFKLYVCRIRRNNPFDVIGKCSFLEELYFKDSFNKFCREINFPTSLQRYAVTRYSWGLEWDKSLSKCVVLCVDEYEDVDILSEATLKYIMQTAEIIKLDGIGWRWRNLIPEIVPVDQGMNDIFGLYLSNISELQYLIKIDVGSRVPNVFSKLVVLDLYGMEKLEELCNGPLSSDSLKNLEQLSITHCKNLRSLFKFNLDLSSLKRMTLQRCPLLVSLFQLSTAKSLMMLEKLTIYDCEKLESIIIDEKRVEESKEEIELVDDGDNENKDRSLMFPKLKVLDISGCSRLETILPYCSGDLSVLETIKINDCEELKYIFDQFVKLGSLKELKLSGLPNFIDIFPDCGHPVPSFVKRSCSTLRDDFKAPTQLDSIKWNAFSWTHKCWYGLKYRHKLRRRSPTSTKTPLVQKDQPQHCPVASIWDRAQCFSRQSQIIMCNITMISLRNISKIKSVFILSITPTMLLETLIIENCDELKHIIVDVGDDSGGNNLGNVFPRLKELEVWACGQLEYIFGHYVDADADDHQSHNEIHLHLPELKSLQLCYLPSLVAMCPKQYHTTFPSLEKLELDNCIQVASKSIIGDFISHASSTTSLDSTTMKNGELKNCIQVAIKSIGDFISHATSTTSLDSTTMKELSGDVEHFLALEELEVRNSKVENVFVLNEINGQQLNLKLQRIVLQYLPVMTNLFVGSKSSVTLQNLTMIIIGRCEKLEIIFSTSVVRCLPQLNNLVIADCKELKYIIEDDVKDEIVLPCFQKLKYVEIINCNKLKYVFPVSICKELHGLEHLIIREAIELQEIFRSKDGQKVEIPNLNYIGFVNLPSLFQEQEIQFQNVKDRHVENCFQKQSLTSASTSGTLTSDVDSGNGNPSAEPIKDFAAGIEVQAATGHELTSSQDLLNEESIGQQCLMNQQYLLGETDTTLKPSQGNNCLKEIKEQTIQEASASGKDISTVSKPPTQLVSPESKQESFKTSIEEGTTIDNDEIVTSSTHLESISLSSELLDTSEHKTSSQEDGYGKISIPSFSTIQINDQRVKDGNLSAETGKDFLVGVEVEAALGHKLTSSQEFLDESSTSQQCLMSQQHLLGENDTTSKPSQGNNCFEETKDESIQEALISEKAITTVMQSFKRSDKQGTTLDNVKTGTTSTHLESISSSSKPLVTFEHQTSLQVKDDEIRVSEPKPSPTTSSLASQSISTPYEGNPPQIMENPSSSSLITWELLQLVSKKHLASENLSLLTDFLIKHPSVHLKDNSRSNKYKGHAYNCLAELLIFLQTHSILDVVGSSRSKFVELLQDARSFEFDKDWLDGVEKRVLFPDLHLSQDALEKLLHSKQQVTKEIEMLNLKIGIFTQHVEELKHQLASSEASLKNIIQQEARVLESRAALSLPLGY